jgi:hypothetical protein
MKSVLKRLEKLGALTPIFPEGTYPKRPGVYAIYAEDWSGEIFFAGWARWSTDHRAPFHDTDGSWSPLHIKFDDAIPLHQPIGSQIKLWRGLTKQASTFQMKEEKEKKKGKGL